MYHVYTQATLAPILTWCICTRHALFFAAHPYESLLYCICPIYINEWMEQHWQLHDHDRLCA